MATPISLLAKPIFFSFADEIILEIAKKLDIKDLFRFFDIAFSGASPSIKSRNVKLTRLRVKSYFFTIQQAHLHLEKKFHLSHFLKIVTEVSLYIEQQKKLNENKRRLVEMAITHLDLASFHFSLAESKGFTTHLAQLGQRCPDLKELILKEPTSQDSPLLLSKNAFKNLEQLTLNNFFFNLNTIEGLPKNLKKLIFSDCKTVTLTKNCFRAFPSQLETLKWSSKISDEDLCFLPRSITSLTLSGEFGINGQSWKDLPAGLVFFSSENKLNSINRIAFQHFHQSLLVSINIENSVYQGDWKNGQRSGQGTFSWQNGCRYKGQWEHDVMSGKGDFYSSNNSLNYSGEWKNGKKEGQGTRYWSTGDYYIGKWKEGFLNGQGTLYCINGDQYTGEWDSNQIHKGLLSYTSGDQYTGEFVNMRKTGQGIQYWSDGIRYEGQWKDDFLEGQGTLYFPNGSRYVGKWHRNLLSKGTLYCAKKGKYVGEFLDMQREGQGTFYWTNGSRYRGEWKGNNPNGQGTLYYKNGDAYKGNWLQGKKSGQGIHYRSTGERYVELWKDNSLIERRLLICRSRRWSI